jgi:hypothetical protein
MNIRADDRKVVFIEVVQGQDRRPRACVHIVAGNGGAVADMDENHAQALILALQGAVAEMQARAVER